MYLQLVSAWTTFKFATKSIAETIIFIRIVATATINFSPAQVQLLFKGVSYSRVALIILDDMGACETDMKSTIVPLPGELLTQYKPSEIHCLRLFVAWLALHAQQNLLILVAKMCRPSVTNVHCRSTTAQSTRVFYIVFYISSIVRWLVVSV